MQKVVFHRSDHIDICGIEDGVEIVGVGAHFIVDGNVLVPRGLPLQNRRFVPEQKV